MMNLFRLLLILTFIQSVHLSGGQLNLSTRAKSAILINAETGAVLFEKGADTRRFPASTTKIIPTIYILDNKQDKLNESLEASAEAIGSIKPHKKEKAKYKLPAWWIEVGSSHVGIKKGEKLSLETLLYGLMVPSGNDAANVITEYIGNGKMAQGIASLNEYVRQVGCQDTHLMNANGLHHPEHYTTARDLAKITAHALKNTKFRKIVKTVRYKRPKSNKQEETTWVQTNKLLRKNKNFYESAIGVKTGYTSKASYCLVAAAESKGRTLIAVFLGCPESGHRFQDATKFFEKAFAEEESEFFLFESGMQPYTLQLPEEGVSVPSYLESGIKVRYFPSEKPNLTAQLLWSDVALPIAKGQKIGELKILSEGNIHLLTAPLLALEPTRTPWFAIFFEIQRHPFFAAALIGVILAAFYFLAARKG